MKSNTLGSSGLEVSEICLGTMTWGNQNTEAEGHTQMDYALDQGINFFDTAEMYAVPPSAETYGKTEEIIGSWFAKSGKRDKVILASKIAGPGLPWIRGGQNRLDKVNIDAAVKGSLKRLQSDVIDLYQLHWPNRGFPHFGRHWPEDVDFTADSTKAVKENITEVLHALQDHIKAGHIRHIGLSNETAWGVMTYLNEAERKELPKIISLQNEYHILKPHDDPFVAETCVRENIAYLPWSPLGGGMLSGKYLNGARPEGSRWSLDNRPNFRDTQNSQKTVKALCDLAQKHELDVCQMALRYVIDQNFVTSTIIGATTMGQLKTNIGAADVRLSDSVKQGIRDIIHFYPMSY